MQSRAWRRLFPDDEGGARTRKQRREWIVRYALGAQEVVGATRRATGARPSANTRAALQLAAREAGVRRVRFASHAVSDPARRTIKSRLGERPGGASVHVAIGSAPIRREGARRTPRRTVVVIARVENGRIVGMRRVDAR